MRFVFLVMALAFTSCQQHGPAPQATVPATAPARWQQQVDSILPLFGHRNWIMVVDKAFPALAASPGMQVINTDADMISVLSFLHGAIQRAPHVTAQIFTDKELAYIPAGKGSAIARFRDSVAQLFGHKSIASILHDSVFTQVAATSHNFQVLILKTNSCIAYSSVYLKLDCKYWNIEKEKALRAALQGK